VVLQRLVEQAGIPTVIIASLPTVAEQLGAPRIAAADTPMGAALGAPQDAGQQTRILTAALGVLETATVPGAVAHLPETYRTAARQVRSEAAVKALDHSVDGRIGAAVG
jgi:hypothetical protein